MAAKFDPQKPFDQAQGRHHRKSIRLQGYDYAQVGAYFVTIVTFQRAGLFGEIVDGEMILNEWGKIIQKWWDDLPSHFPGIETGAFVIMPNHVHGIIIITAGSAVPAPNATDESTFRGGEIRSGETPPLHKKPTLGQIVAYFKYQSTKEINALAGAGVVTKLWQRNYYERIIRNEREMDAIWHYIENNPAMWNDDNENPTRHP